ncbi:hypothetical protein NQ317_012321, partial [Molorchus minor]
LVYYKDVIARHFLNMQFLKILLCLTILLVDNLCEQYKKPTLLISILVRNKAHTLPYFLSNLEQLNYPKNRISLWIKSDHNFDQSIEILKLWVSSVKDHYHSINTEYVEGGENFPEESSPSHWTEERFNHLIELRESALPVRQKYLGRLFICIPSISKMGKYLFYQNTNTIDCDVFLTNPETLNYLVSKDYTVVAPMLRSDGLYSNFWHGMTSDYYYERTEEYKPVLYRENIGCFNVPMVHSCVLINLRKTESDLLTYNPKNINDYNGPNDDIITFAISANRSSVSLNLCNEEKFGFVMVPLEQGDQIGLDYEQLSNIKLEVLNDYEPLYVSELLRSYTIGIPEKDTLGFDRIFMINLERRPERRRRMHACFDEIGMDVTSVEAVDGR